MKCKLQIMTARGWADLKTTEDDVNYETEIFLSKCSAKLEKMDLEDLGHEVRIVAPDEPQEFDLYE